MEIDEVNLASPQLQDLIDSKIEAKFKKIEAKLVWIAEKNNASTTASSTHQKKKNHNKNNKTKTKKHNNNSPQPAANVDSDSSDANKATQRWQRGRPQNQRRSVQFSVYLAGSVLSVWITSTCKYFWNEISSIRLARLQARMFRSGREHTWSDSSILKSYHNFAFLKIATDYAA